LTGNVIEWIDKSYLCTSAAEGVGWKLIWHKLVRRRRRIVLIIMMNDDDHDE